jgi:2'-5' RNA ligase
VKTKKLFVAIATHQGLEDSAAPIIKKLRINAEQKEIEIRWVPGKNYHVTLHFLGNIHLDTIPEIENTLAEIASETPPFKLKISDMGAFPDDSASRVVWFGVQNSKALRALQETLAERLAHVSYSREKHEFSPHLTVGRLRNPHRTKDLLSPFVRKSLAKISVSEIVLYESTGDAPFPVYKPLKLFQLEGIADAPDSDDQVF